MRWYCVPASLAGGLFIASSLPDGAVAQNAGLVRSDVSAVFGYYGVTNGHSERRFATAWGNAYFGNGFGTHVEAHFMDREETAEFFAGGLSWKGAHGEVRGALGTSTANDGILPEFQARLEAVFRRHAELGLVVSSALSHRSYRNGAEDTSAEVEAIKYVGLESGSLIFSALARATLVDPGSHISASFGAGLAYAQARKFSIGIMVEGGRAAYDGLLGAGMVDEAYFSIRPTAAVFLTDQVELFGMMEYMTRESYSIFGGHLGLKIHFD